MGEQKRELMHILQMVYSRQTGFRPRICMATYIAMSYILKYSNYSVSNIAMIVLVILAFRLYDTFAVRSQVFKDMISGEIMNTRKLVVKNLLMTIIAYIMVLIIESRIYARNPLNLSHPALPVCAAWVIISRVLAVLDYRKRKDSDTRMLDAVVSLTDSLDEEAVSSRYFKTILKQHKSIHVVK